MSEASQQLNDLRIEWEGTSFGLMPVVVEGALGEPRELDEPEIQALLDALSDPGAFVNAHVLLTHATAIEHETFPAWNGLAVDIAADGSVTIDPEQRHALAARWSRWFRSDPRPATLPDA